MNAKLNTAYFNRARVAISNVLTSCLVLAVLTVKVASAAAEAVNTDSPLPEETATLPAPASLEATLLPRLTVHSIAALVESLSATEPSDGDDAAHLATNPVDTASMDIGMMDPGSMSPGSMDPGSMHPGSLDTGSTHAGSMDSGSTRAGSMDTGSAHPGSMDTGKTHTGSMDIGPMDTGQKDRLQSKADSAGIVKDPVDKPATPTTAAADTESQRTQARSNQPPPLPVAEDVDLSEPVVLPNEPVAPTSQTDGEPDTTTSATTSPGTEQEAETNVPLALLGEEVAPGTSARLSWSPDQHFDGISVPTPVLVVNGNKPGKTLCLTAAIHGDELNGIEIVRRVMYDLEPEKLSGAVIGVPIVNLQGFRRNSRYLPDRRDLNRFFPGRAGGSSASRMAHSFFSQVIRHCDALVDIHTGSFLRTNLPQLRADMSVAEVAALTEGFGATAVLHSSSTEGTLRRAAVMAGIPAVTLETGEPSRLQEKEIEHGTKGVQTLLTKLEMTRRVRVWGDPEPVYYKSVWVRADDGGLLFTSVKLGQRVRKGQVLGTITDPITNVRNELMSPFDGRVLGMALNQVVLPGFATFRIGIPSNEKEVAAPTSSPEGAVEPASPTIPESEPTEVDIEDENS